MSAAGQSIPPSLSYPAPLRSAAVHRVEVWHPSGQRLAVLCGDNLDELNHRAKRWRGAVNLPVRVTPSQSP